MHMFHVLGIAPTQDERAIRRAYAVQLKQHRPDEDPSGFQRVHEAYEQALNWARRGQHDTADDEDALFGASWRIEVDADIRADTSAGSTVYTATPEESAQTPFAGSPLTCAADTPEPILQATESRATHNGVATPNLLAWEWFDEAHTLASKTEPAATEQAWDALLSAPELQQIEVRQLLSHRMFGLLAGWAQAHQAGEDGRAALPRDLVRRCYTLFDWQSDELALARNFDTDEVDAVLGLVSSAHVPSPTAPAVRASGPWPLRFLRSLLADAFKSNARPAVLACVGLALLSAFFFYVDSQRVLHPKTPSGEEIDVSQPLPVPTSQHYDNASTAYANGQWNAALTAIDAVIRDEPDSASAWVLRGRIHRALAQPSNELADYEQALALRRHPTTLNQLAWVLATSAAAPAAADAARSLALAREANVLSGFKNAAVLDTLAAAYAAQGDFAKAMYWQNRAIRASANKQDAQLAAHLALFKQQRRVVETALSESEGEQP